jgi:hypothetical protein
MSLLFLFRSLLKDKRVKVVQEIIDTEKSYLQDMLLIERCMDKLKPILSQEDISTLFW